MINNIISGNISIANKTSIEGEVVHGEAKLPPIYSGSYIVTPTDEAQTLDTVDKRMADNLVINPIPSNYGKITWNGSFLTVS